MTPKDLVILSARLPLLFMIDSILKGTFLDFREIPVGPLAASFQPQDDSDDADFPLTPSLPFWWYLMLCFVTVLSLVLLCSPLELLWKVYRCVTCFAVLLLSYQTNSTFIKQELTSGTANDVDSKDGVKHDKSIAVIPTVWMLIRQTIIALLFEQLCRIKVLYEHRNVSRLLKRFKMILFISSFSFPIVLRSFVSVDLAGSVLSYSPLLGLSVPCLMLFVQTIFVIVTLVTAVVLPALKYARGGVREVGVDGLVMQLMEKANLKWLLRIFFCSRVFFQLLTSKILSEIGRLQDLNEEQTLETIRLVILEVLCDLCATIISVMSVASVVSLLGGWSVRIIYKIIGADEEEENLQPAVLGFLFVLLAMQTGLTGFGCDVKLKLFFQNCVLLTVANQHFVQTVASDLILKACAEDASLHRHIRPLLPYIVFFSFPFVVVLRLWDYPFRLSWLLAITAFSIELMIKSVTTLSIYAINMFQAHMELVSENIEDLLFYLKAVCSCLEFTCGVFLFFNGAYIFFFESGGLIRLVMMIIHFYCNIYQSALRGWATYKLRSSAWQKVNKFPAASQEDLDDNDDVCSVCYQEMKEAVVIPCSHLFHKACLQKWLSIQEKCPLCHTQLTESEAEADVIPGQADR